MLQRKIAHFEIIEKLGEGGMGVVYKAHDVHLDRFVAIKVLPADKVADAERKRRFVKEARAASALNHPNIVTVHEIAQEEGVDFIVMEHVAGETLAELIGSGGLPLGAAIQYAAEIADALTVAHAAGIVHRDLKPGNVMVTESQATPTGLGHVKVLDFGLAKLTQPSGSSDEDATRSLATVSEAGTIVGTAAYMSPEQAQGRKVDARSDVFSLGAVLYEMLTGRRAFSGDSLAATAYSVVHSQPRPLREARPDAPKELVRIVERALAKNPEERYSSAELAADLAALRSGAAERGRPRFLVPAIAAAVVLAAALGWRVWRDSQVRWGREVALPEVIRLSDQGSYVAAFDLARQAERWIPSDPMLARALPDITRTVSIETQPAGAQVRYKEYGDPKAEWRQAGVTPFAGARVPRGFFLWRIEAPGHPAVDLAGPEPPARLVLHRAAEIPEGAALVMAGRFAPPLGLLGALPPVEMPEFWIDKFEVTNKQFKKFVDESGYRKREYWKQPFMKDGKAVSWEEAMAAFHDATGRPGPATWEAGTYAEGKNDFPVAGVSWYEAAAYAQFAGKDLPTYYQWHRAALTATAAQVAPLSNFGGGLARVGERSGMSPTGAYDMAGNVREWTSTENNGTRYILGGAWDEPSYTFSWPVWVSPWDRSPKNGFRCVKNAGPLPAQMTEALRPQIRDPAKQKPVSEDAFRVFRSMYTRDPAPLEAKVEARDESAHYWIREKVSYNTGSPKQRLTALLLVPKEARRPLQSIIFIPGSNSITAKSLETAVTAATPGLDFVMKSGRALVFPTLWGAYERQAGLQVLQHNRDAVVQWVRDLGATIDYLESRPEFDRGKIAYMGTSMGARLGTILTPLESRIKVGLLLDGGLPFTPRAPEADELNFAPRVRIPTLMVNGRHDHIWPLEQSQKPLFRLLGPAEKDKKHVLVEASHGALVRKGDVAREVLDWLDRYLGPAR